MNKTQLFCNGYVGVCEFNPEDNVWHGKIENIADLITFQSDYFDNVWAAFSESVDDYLSLCEELDKNHAVS